jgi:hypothetical protein
MAKKHASSLASDGSQDLAYIAEQLRPLAVLCDGLLVDPANARTHPEPNLGAIRASLSAYGQRKPIIVNRHTGIVEAGNCTLEVARSLGWSHVAVVYVDDDPARTAGFSLADNRTAELAGWDTGKLNALLKEIGDGQGEGLDALFADLAKEAGSALDGSVKLKPIKVQDPPRMTWVLVGIPTVRFGEIAAAVEGIAALPDILCETAANDG